MRYILLLLVFFGTSQLVAKSSSKKSQRSQPKYVLDFEAQVIEGEKKTPDIFSQLSLDKSKSKAVVFSRKNFSDRASREINSRPKYQDR